MKKLGYRPKEVSVNISDLITKRKNSESFFGRNTNPTKPGSGSVYSQDRSLLGLHEFDTPVRSYNTERTDVMERMSNGHFSETRRTQNLNFLKKTYFIDFYCFRPSRVHMNS